jgi:hypothetical protein
MLAVVAVLMTSNPASAYAQFNVERFSSPRTVYFGGAGLDPAVLATAGIGRVLSVGQRPLLAYLESSIAMGDLDLRDYRARLGVQASMLSWRDMRLTGNVAFVTRGTRNPIFDATSMGADVGGTIGMYRPRWFVAGEAGYDKAIITHLAHSDQYRTQYYADAKDGWYIDTGGIRRFGLVGGISRGRWDLVLRAGVPRTQRGNSLVAPAYATMTWAVGF